MALLRWIIGPVRREGFVCLSHSVRSAKKLYPELNLLICHNRLDDDQLALVNRLDVPTFDQKDAEGITATRPNNNFGFCWKLYPPRISLGEHEIVMDNDVVLEKRVPQIDSFLNGDHTLFCEGVLGLHGRFGKHIEGVKVNSGIYGMPPGFDFAAVCRKICGEKKLSSWERRHDEQGIVGATLLSYDEPLIVPLTTVAFLRPHAKYQSGFCGYHFSGINSRPDHPPWRQHLSKIIKIT